MVIKVCQGSPKALRNLLQAYHKKEFADMVKEEEEEEENKFKVPHKGKNKVLILSKRECQPKRMRDYEFSIMSDPLILT